MGVPKSASSAACVVVFALGTAILCACTTLGPMPAMTGIPVPPLERPSVELQIAAMPGYHLSSAVSEEPEANVLPQVMGVFEPDELIRAPGLLVGARYAGERSAGAALEPLLGYRTFLDDGKRFSLAALGFLAYADGTDNGASFTAWRGGVEAGVDARITGKSEFVELHTNLGATFTGMDASGEYCLGAGGTYGIDCPREPSQRQVVPASAGGIFPSAHAGVSLDFARHLHAPFHGVRLAFDLAGGTLPTLRAGEQHSAKLYGTGGLSLTLGLGASSGSGAR